MDGALPSKPNRGTHRATIALSRGMVGLCFAFSLIAEGAPTAVRHGMVVRAQVLEVDCSLRPVKKKACAPMVVTTEAPQSGPVKTVVTTAHSY